MLPAPSRFYGPISRIDPLGHINVPPPTTNRVLPNIPNMFIWHNIYTFHISNEFCLIRSCFSYCFKDDITLILVLVLVSKLLAYLMFLSSYLAFSQQVQSIMKAWVAMLAPPFTGPGHPWHKPIRWQFVPFHAMLCRAGCYWICYCITEPKNSVYPVLHISLCVGSPDLVYPGFIGPIDTPEWPLGKGA